MRLKGEKGFTLVEVIVVAAIIAILAGILVPMIFSQIDEAKISRAKGDIRSITSAIYAFRKDVGTWPMNATAGCTSTMLKSDGPAFSAALSGSLDGKAFNMASVETFSSQLMDDPGCYNNWNGPYLGSVDVDPWGNPYIMSTVNIEDPATAILVLSAGPDGVITTDVADNSVDSEDIGIRLK